MPAPLHRHSRTTWFFLIGGTLFLVWFLLLAFLLLIVPKFEENFRDFGVALPWLSRMTIQVSRLMTGSNPGQSIPGWLAAPLCLPVIVAIAWGACRSSPRGARWCLILSILTGVLLLAGGFASMLLPTFEMHRTLQQGGV